MDVVVDLERCQGHGKCYLRAPELFEPADDWGHARVRTAVDPDDDEGRERAQSAIDGCPERALRWAEADGPGSGVST